MTMTTTPTEKTDIIILAQGRQERLGDTIAMPKQLLPLPACGDTPILQRTLIQIARILWGGAGSIGQAVERAHRVRIEVVAWHEVHSGIKEVVMTYRDPYGSATLAMLPRYSSLPDPGNSSLKGIHRYLEARALTAGDDRADRTVVLLGDVIYSWACLGSLIFFDSFPPEPVRCAPWCGDILFAGTSDISHAGGELWGLGWKRSADAAMHEALDRALAKHPPYQGTYQPGQLRRWMWALHPSFQTTKHYAATSPGDYTKDVDVPADLELVPKISRYARAEDLDHGLEW